ncbi:MAG: glutamate--tRNA ligase [Patescibacteria group bacterium]
MSVKTRIAPSPTGAPHVATAYIALFNWAFAKKNKGKFILRIEDTDQARLVKGSQEQILESLEWLGLNWDEGPISQSSRLPIYQKHAEELIEKDQAYYCFCSSERLDRVRQEAQQKGLPPRYDGHCRSISKDEAQKRAKNEKFVVRLKVPQEGQTSFQDSIRGEISFENNLLDDQVLLKSDGFPTYHLAVVVDDHLMGITHVIRGEEWISSTPKHILLYQAFGWGLPQFAHLSLLREADRAKLSKRHGSVGILEFKEEGYLPEALLNFLALLGWSHPKGKEVFPLEEFVKEVDLKRLTTTAPVFDRQKLDWLNGEYIRQMPILKLGERLSEYLKQYRGREVEEETLKSALPLVRERLKKLSEFESLAGFLFNDVAWSRDLLIQKGDSASSAAEKLQSSQEILLAQKQWEAPVLERACRTLAKEKDWKSPDLFMLLRVAATGSTISPPLFESLEALGRERSLKRIAEALKILRID